MSALPDPVPGRLAYGTTIMVGLAVLTPYVMPVPNANMQLITQAQTALIAGWTMILAFYYKSKGDALKDNIIATQANTAAAAQAANTPTPDVTIQPGQTATVAATPDNSNA